MVFCLRNTPHSVNRTIITTGRTNDDLNCFCRRFLTSEHCRAASKSCGTYLDTNTQWNGTFQTLLTTCYLWHLWICTSLELPNLFFPESQFALSTRPFVVSSVFYCTFSHLKPTKRPFVSSNLTIIFFCFPPKERSKDHFPRSRSIRFRTWLRQLQTESTTAVGTPIFIYFYFRQPNYRRFTDWHQL